MYSQSCHSVSSLFSVTVFGVALVLILECNFVFIFPSQFYASLDVSLILITDFVI